MHHKLCWKAFYKLLQESCNKSFIIKFIKKDMYKKFSISWSLAAIEIFKAKTKQGYDPSRERLKAAYNTRIVKE